MNKHPRKLSQHFLNSAKIAQRIIAHADIRGKTVLEIGPGKGILTKEIAPQAAHVIAIEFDERMVNDLASLALPNVHIIHDDFLQHNISQYGVIVCIGNIPYRISSAIIEKIVAHHEAVTSATLTVQTEFAQRLVASPGTRNYGYVSVRATYHYTITRLFGIAPRFFTPPPRVSSAVIQMKRKPVPFPLENEEAFFGFVKKILCYPRKSVRNAVKYAGGILPEAYDNGALNKRPNSLSIRDFYDLFSTCQKCPHG